MTQTMRVEALEKIEHEYAGVFCSLGYEARASFVAAQFPQVGERRYAIAFDDRRELSYDANREVYGKARYEIVDVPANELRQWLRRTATEVEGSTPPGRKLLVDISSMSRTRISLFVEELCLRAWRSETEVQFIYVPAAFGGKPEAAEIANTHVGPVAPLFAGWAVDPDLPPAVILGLGYEQDRALGAVEHIEPGAIWAFLPVSPDPRYDPALYEANDLLLDEISPSRIMHYEVLEPLDCLGKLQALVGVAGRSYNPIFVPFGPKIFALCAMLVAGKDRRCGVWRVSAEGAETPIERRPIGRWCGLSVLCSQ